MSATSKRQQRQRIHQIPDRPGYEAIFNANYLEDISEQLQAWKCKRVFLVHSKALDKNTTKIQDLRKVLGNLIVDEKAGVGSHSPYQDVIDIAHRLHTTDVDCLVSIGSCSYSDACKIAVLMHASLPPNFTADDMESIIDQTKGWAGHPDSKSPLKDPKIKLIVVPTSLSVSEWNAVSSATNAAGKKQHFGVFDGKSTPDLIIMDPEVASTSPPILWCSSGFRAIDHCVETICNTSSHGEANILMEHGLRFLIKGLKEYKEGKDDENKEELLARISECQWGSRDAIMGIIKFRIPLGPSHTIGHQLGSIGKVMHGVTSAIMLAPVLRYTEDRNPTAQVRVVGIFNDVLGWQETEAGDAIERFAMMLDLPTRLSEVRVEKDEQVISIAERTMTDVWGGQKRQWEYEEIVAILEMVR